MSLKDKLKKAKEKLLYIADKDYEFEAVIENHPIPDGDVYRLRYVNYHRFGQSYGMGPNNVGVIDYTFDPFRIPEGMTRSDAFKVLSYMTDFIEKNDDIDECSLQSVRTLNSALDLERFGFTRADCKGNIIDLITVTGRIALFKKSELYKKYFDWYTKGVSIYEVKRIYEKCGMEFRDLVWVDNNCDDEKSKQNVKKK